MFGSRREKTERQLFHHGIIGINIRLRLLSRMASRHGIATADEESVNLAGKTPTQNSAGLCDPVD